MSRLPTVLRSVAVALLGVVAAGLPSAAAEASDSVDISGVVECFGSVVTGAVGAGCKLALCRRWNVDPRGWLS